MPTQAMTSTRKIGDVEFSSVGFGLMGLSANYGQTDPDEERFKVLDRAYELGCRHWDSAFSYGDSEELVGRWFKRTGKRSEIFLATKFGTIAKPQRRICGTPEYARESLETSLRRLDIDFVDLFYVHRIDQTIPIEVTVGALAEFVKEGKIRYVGLSECSADTLRRAHAVHPIAAVQIEYSPFCLDIEDPKINLLQTARELGVKIVAYSPLGRGLLTGRYRSPEDFEEGDFRRIVPRFSKENFPRILALADEFKKLGEKHNASAGQIALAWVLAQGEDIIPIPGTKKIKYLEENFSAADVKLSDEENASVRSAADRAGLTHGGIERYPPLIQKELFANTPPL